MLNLFLRISLPLALLLTSALANAQKPIKRSFQVSGVCEMCAERIESALDVKGVKRAEYDLATHTLNVVYSEKHISFDDINAKLNAVGHDTEFSKASDEQYDTVHHCCKYREHEGH